MAELVNIIGEACRILKQDYSQRAEELGYHFHTEYNKTLLEEEGKGEIYVHAEYKRLLFEKGQDKDNLRALIPRKLEYEGGNIKVLIRYVQLPQKVRHQLKLAKTARSTNK